MYSFLVFRNWAQYVLCSISPASSLMNYEVWLETIKSWLYFHLLAPQAGSREHKSQYYKQVHFQGSFAYCKYAHEELIQLFLVSTRQSHDTALNKYIPLFSNKSSIFQARVASLKGTRILTSYAIEITHFFATTLAVEKMHQCVCVL